MSTLTVEIGWLADLVLIDISTVSPSGGNENSLVLMTLLSAMTHKTHKTNTHTLNEDILDYYEDVCVTAKQRDEWCLQLKRVDLYMFL